MLMRQLLKTLAYIALVVLCFCVAIFFLWFPTIQQVDCAAWGACWSNNDYLKHVFIFLLFQIGLYMFGTKIIRLSLLHIVIILLVIYVICVPLISYILGFDLRFFF